MPHRRGPRSVSPVVMLCLAFVISLPAVTARTATFDEVEFFSWLHSISVDRVLFCPERIPVLLQLGQVKNPSFHQNFLEEQNTAGCWCSLRPSGAHCSGCLLFGLDTYLRS